MCLTPIMIEEEKKRYKIIYGNGITLVVGEVTEKEAITEAFKQREKDPNLKLWEIGGGEVDLPKLP